MTECTTCIHKDVCGKREYWHDDKLAAFNCEHYISNEPEKGNEDA